MTKTTTAVACLAAIVAAGIGGQARAGEQPEISASEIQWMDDTMVGEAPIIDGVTIGPWTVSPMIGMHGAPDAVSGAGSLDDTRAISLGFRGAAKVDSRFGAIYSRLSLSFERRFRTDGHRPVTGLPGGGRIGYYGNRTEVDVMTLGAVFALPLSPAVTGFVDYDTEMDLGTGAEHEVVLRLKIGF